jgi:hypothetical protein
VAAHLAAVGYLMLRVTRDIYNPRYDPIRRHHLDDPHGGPFAGAPDWFRLGFGGASRPVLPWKAGANA